jgi:2-amino-4-hydroxy-6-hydroxymethyldihydropteridine diphosphokinase
MRYFGEVDVKNALLQGVTLGYQVNLSVCIRMWAMTIQLMIAMGGNMPFQGRPVQDTIALALAALARPELAVHAVSRCYKTPCFPVGAGPNYVNAAAVITAPKGVNADTILARLHEIEADFGRVRSARWGGRTLDIDLLGMGGAILPDLAIYSAWADLPLAAQAVRAPGQLILPHPRLHERAFVLVPLCDVAPAWVHPVLGRTVAQMCADLPADARAEVVAL